MKDSRIGTYALVGMTIILTMKFKCIEALLSLENAPVGHAQAPLVSFLSLQPAGAALIAAHTISRWSSIALIYLCPYIQDEEDAKRGLYNWFAQSKRLLTPPRLLLGTLSAIFIPYCTLGLERALILYATVLVVTILSGYYGILVLGGVVGDYLGATIQVAELACYLALTANWQVVLEDWRPFVTLAVVAAIPLIYCRRIIKTADC